MYIEIDGHWVSQFELTCSHSRSIRASSGIERPSKHQCKAVKGGVDCSEIRKSQAGADLSRLILQLREDDTCGRTLHKKELHRKYRESVSVQALFPAFQVNKGVFYYLNALFQYQSMFLTISHSS